MPSWLPERIAKMTEKIEQKDSQSWSENEAEKLYRGAKEQLISLAANMQLIIPKPDVAQLFLGAGLAVLLSFGEGVTRDWLQTALDALDDDPAKLH
jgi:hypothetical protein